MLRANYLRVSLSSLQERVWRLQVLFASRWFRKEAILDPVFIIGAPRSGTTLLGGLLGSHSSVCYVNEPKWLWARLCPRWDSYGAVVDPSGAKIRLTDVDLELKEMQRLRSAFSYLLTKSKAKLLVEKTPDNSARVPWLLAVFPGARFVHILRDPHSMAISLQKALLKWFPDGWKGTAQFEVWNRHLRSMPDVLAVWQQCTDDYERALIIWRELNRLAAQDAELLGEDRYLRLKYEDLLLVTENSQTELLEFLNIPLTTSQLNLWTQVIRPNSPNSEVRDANRISWIVGESLLEKFGY